MHIIETQSLRKVFTVRQGKGGPQQTIEAVKDLSLAVDEGQIFGFLGPNGAGKSTAMRLLTTLLLPTAGQARVAGFDLLRQPEEVRRRIGYVSQAGGADGDANVPENLVLQARLYGLSPQEARRRSETLIEALDLGEFAGRPAKSYSGGQRRRLDLALAMVHQPRLLFLDEPTTGLDPQMRTRFWEEIRRLGKEGVTVFLTTHYLEEADALADTLAILDHGQIVAEGTPAALKRQISGDSIRLSIPSQGDREAHIRALLESQPYIRELQNKGETWQVRVSQGESQLPQLLRLMDENGYPVEAASLMRPSLDDVFLRQTGRSLRENGMN